MICFETHITETSSQFLERNIKKLDSIDNANLLLKNTSGINHFFTEQANLDELKVKLKEKESIVSEPNRREYGDFQTNSTLTNRVVQYISSKENDFEFVLEPTCGKGNFLISTLQQFPSLKKMIGVEIYLPYVWETKFKILDYFLINKRKQIPEIEIHHANAFEYSYKDLANKTKEFKTLVIGNPPWITNSELSSISSTNLPQKTNFKKHKGFEAITGKGNFDIGEYISLILLDSFQKHNGAFAFLVKNSVIKNIIFDQQVNHYSIADSEKLNIDAKKEFNVSVNASLFYTKLNTKADSICKEFDFYSNELITNFGWYKSKFVYSIADYDLSSFVDGKSEFIWRSGLKHDCSKIMELVEKNGKYINGLKNETILEKDLVYGLLKSSDLKNDRTTTFRKQTIVTQKKIGQSTSYISKEYPATFKYLTENKAYFEKRKSSIYKGKPAFSIFGIGDYSFAPFKVAISGLYKSTHFTLILPNENKPIMLDDTCYFIGFKKQSNAEIAHFLLNSTVVQSFLKAIIFSDSKRSVNKDTLMRIDIESVYRQIEYDEIKHDLKSISKEEWLNFETLFDKEELTENKQMSLF